MSKLIRIDYERDCSELYGTDNIWTTFVRSDLFEHCVIYGNRDYQEHKEAAWYKKADSLLASLQYWYDDPSEAKDEYNLSDEQYEKIMELYNKCRCTDDIMCDVIGVLNPDKKIISTTIRGCVQADWQNVIYIEDSFDIRLLKDFYFNQIVVAEMYEDGEYEGSAYIAESEIPATEEERIKYVREFFNVADSEKCRIMESDGYIQVKQWKKVA